MDEWLIRKKRSMDKEKKRAAAKEISNLVGATAEASPTAGDETAHQQQQQQPPLTPRKRGRPRKIVERGSGGNKEEDMEESTKVVKGGGEEVDVELELEQLGEELVKEEEEAFHEGVELSKIGRSRARRRKSIPRRSC